MTEKIMQNQDIEQMLKQAVFNAVRTRETYPDYPTMRLTNQHPEVARQLQEGRISLLPEGPWDAGIDKLKPQSLEQLALLRLQGYNFDDLGRPLHPWLLDMLQDPEVGVVTGTGAYWKMGPNRTADPIVITREAVPHVLLIQRNDNDLWAFAGGFIDDEDKDAAEITDYIDGISEHTVDGVVAAKREPSEEAGYFISGPPERLIYNGVVADSRTTTYAWAETTALLWRVDKQSPLTPDYSEVKDARWVPINALPNRLHGSHGVLLQEALKYVT